MTDFNTPSPAGRYILRAKIHRASVTETLLDYEGSCGIDQVLLDEADIIPGEKIEIYNMNNGQRFSTYAIPEPRGSGQISLNGSAARLAVVGDELIICTYTFLEDFQAKMFNPRIVLVDKKNHIRKMRTQGFSENAD